MYSREREKTYIENIPISLDQTLSWPLLAISKFRTFYEKSELQFDWGRKSCSTERLYHAWGILILPLQVKFASAPVQRHGWHTCARSNQARWSHKQTFAQHFHDGCVPFHWTDSSIHLHLSSCPWRGFPATNQVKNQCEWLTRTATSVLL